MNACAQFLVPIGRHWLFYAPLQATAALVNEAAAQALRDGRLDALPVSNRPALEMILANPQGDVSPREGALAPTMLGIVPTRGCNMACSYCNFEGPSAALTTMPLSTATAAVDWAASQVAGVGGDTLSVQFFGGEPFVARDVVETVVHRARAVAASSGIGVRFDASTNGNYGASTCRFIADHFDSIVLSLDGPADVQDRNRPLSHGRSSATIVERTGRMLGESPIELCLRMCVTQESVQRMRAIVQWMIASFDPNTIDLETLTPGPLAEKAGLRPPDPYLFARGAVECQRIGRDAGVSVIYAAALGVPPRKTFCPVGSDAAIVLPDGVIAACYLQPEEWVARDLDLRYGHIDATGQVHVDRAALQAVRTLPAHKPRCADCFCRFGCAGGCHVNQTYPGCADTYTDFCTQTRVLTAIRLLQEIGADAMAEALLADRQAMAALAVRHGDGLRAGAREHRPCPPRSSPPAPAGIGVPVQHESARTPRATALARAPTRSPADDAGEAALPQVAPGTRWVVDTRGVSVFEATGDRHALAYPLAAVWTLLAQGTGRPRLLRLLKAIASLDDAAAGVLLDQCVARWLGDGWLEPVPAAQAH
jgi:radical SAM protein with 4Fe4S-binding SPASM domain